MDFLMNPSRAQQWWNWTWFSATGTQQLHRDRRLQPAGCGHGPHEIHQPWAPDAARDRPSPHITSPATEDHYDRWSPKSWIKWTQWTL